MSTIVKKCWPEYFQLILDGQKTYELRLADFKCKPGDILVLKEWSPETKEYTGREIKKTCRLRRQNQRLGSLAQRRHRQVWLPGHFTP